MTDEKGYFDWMADYQRELSDKNDKTFEDGYQKGKEDTTEEIYYYIKRECNPYGSPTIDFQSGIKMMRYLDNLAGYTIEGDE